MHPQTEFSPETIQALAHKWSQNTLALNTRRGYANDWKLFTAWCDCHAYNPLPAETAIVRLYLVEFVASGRKVSTAIRHATSIGYYHRDAGVSSPCDERLWTLLVGARRDRGEMAAQKHPISVTELRAMLAATEGADALLARNRSILLFGFATALRRSNLSAVDLADVAIDKRGMLVIVRREKWNRTGDGRVIAVPRGKTSDTCAVSALEQWLQARGDAPGPLFTAGSPRGLPTLNRLHPGRFAIIVQKAAKRIGYDPRNYGAHSLRAGFVTEALAEGAGEIRVAEQTGHKSLNSLRRYYRQFDLFRGNACSVLDL